MRGSVRQAAYATLAEALPEWRAGKHESCTLFRDLPEGCWAKVRCARDHAGALLVLVSRSFPMVGTVQVPVRTTQHETVEAALRRVDDLVSDAAMPLDVGGVS